MSESPQYEAFRAFALAHIELAVIKATKPLEDEIRSLKTQLETRSAPQAIEPTPGKDGKDGRGISRIYIQPDGILAVRYTDSTEEYSVGKVVGEKGETGKDGKGEKGDPGERGENGKDSTTPGPKGDTGERGANGIATREEMESIIEARFADVQVRTFADIYEGVYDKTKTYNRGKLVTWDGSLHLALADTNSPPGTSASWKLIAKRGRDASRS